MTRGPDARLRDILARLSSIADAEEVMAAASEHGDDRMTDVALDAILYHLVVIGEAVRTLPDDMLATEPDIPWRLIVGMRNRLAHEYFRLRPELVRLTIDEPLRQLGPACLRLLGERQP